MTDKGNPVSGHGSDDEIRVVVTREDVAGIPPGACGPGSMLGIDGISDDGSRVQFKTRGRFVLDVLSLGPQVVYLYPEEILRDGQE